MNLQPFQGIIGLKQGEVLSLSILVLYMAEYTKYAQNKP
jgi:hypothetical protein